MPPGYPKLSIASFKRAEQSIRETGEVDDELLKNLAPYWADLIRLLKVFSCKQKKQADKIVQVKGQMSSKTYFPFIDKTLSQMV
jgi:hypothetical protein